MSEIRLKVTAMAGAPIDRVCREMCALADRIDIGVDCDFNEVKLMALPGDSPIQLAAAWERQLHSKLPYKLARGEPVKKDPSA